MSLTPYPLCVFILTAWLITGCSTTVSKSGYAGTKSNWTFANAMTFVRSWTNSDSISGGRVMVPEGHPSLVANPHNRVVFTSVTESGLDYSCEQAAVGSQERMGTHNLQTGHWARYATGRVQFEKVAKITIRKPAFDEGMVKLYDTDGRCLIAFKSNSEAYLQCVAHSLSALCPKVQ